MSATAAPTSAPELLAPAGDWDAMRAALAITALFWTGYVPGENLLLRLAQQYDLRVRAGLFTVDIPIMQGRNP